MEEKQLKAIEIIMSNPFDTEQELANKCCIDRATLWRWRNIPEFQAELQKRLDQQWKSLLIPAQRKMEQLMASDNEQISLGATKFVMESLGKKAVEQIDLNAKGNVLTVVKADDSK